MLPDATIASQARKEERTGDHQHFSALNLLRSELTTLGDRLWTLAAGARRRHLLFPTIVAAEFLLLAAFALEAPASQPAPGAAKTIALVNVAAKSETPPAPEPQPVEAPQPVVVPPPPKLETVTPIPAAPVFNAAAAARAGFGTTCDVAHTLERGFGDDPLLSAELGRIGPGSRSVANAIMVWDGQWVDLSGDTPEDALETVRRAIVEAVRAAPPECLTQDLSGPRFVAVSRSDTTTVLVLGSGSWRWEQLLLEPPMPAAPPERTS